MSFNLPPPWNPGFALPDNVKDEGLERKAFVTEMTPRGFYDQHAKFSTGNWAEPQYVRNEGLGRGATTTFMMPRGTAPNVPYYLNQRPQVQQRGDDFSFEALSGTDDTYAHEPSVKQISDAPLHRVFTTFGSQSAAVLIQRAGKLAPGKREPFLRTVMNKIDKSLWKRTQSIAARYRKAGMDKGAAFSRALARAMAAGLAAEMVHKGHKIVAGRPPASRTGLLGLGCARMAMGDTTTPPAVTGPRVFGTIGGTTATRVGASGLTVDTHGCTLQSGPGSPNPPPGWTWDPNCPGQGGGKIGCYRPLASLPLLQGYAAKVGAQFLTGDGLDSLANPIARPNPNPPTCITREMVQGTYAGTFMVGPFAIPTDPRVTSFGLGWTNPLALAQHLPTDWLNAIRSAFNPYGRDSANPVTVAPTPQGPQPDLFSWLQVIGVAQPIDFNLIASKHGFVGSWWDFLPNPSVSLGLVDAGWQGISGQMGDLTGPPEPFVNFTHPLTGADWGGWISVVKSGTGSAFQISFAPIPDKPWWQSIAETIFSPAASLGSVTGDAVKDTLGTIGGLVCDATSNPAIAQAGGAAAGAAIGGVPGAKAGAAGGAMASAACHPQTPFYMPQGSGMTTILLVAGGVGLIALLATRKKRTP